MKTVYSIKSAIITKHIKNNSLLFPLKRENIFPLIFVRKYVYSQTQQQQTRETIKYVTWLKKKNRVPKVQANSRPFNVTKDSVHYFTFYSSKVHVIQNETKAERLLTLSPFVVTINAD